MKGHLVFKIGPMSTNGNKNETMYSCSPCKCSLCLALKYRCSTCTCFLLHLPSFLSIQPAPTTPRPFLPPSAFPSVSMSTSLPSHPPFLSPNSPHSSLSHLPFILYPSPPMFSPPFPVPLPCFPRLHSPAPHAGSPIPIPSRTIPTWPPACIFLHLPFTRSPSPATAPMSSYPPPSIQTVPFSLHTSPTCSPPPATNTPSPSTPSPSFLPLPHSLLSVSFLCAC